MKLESIHGWSTTIASLVAAAALFTPLVAKAAELFAGKQIRLIIPGSQSGAYALYGQLARRHLGRFIPDNPTIVISYMSGAAGLTAMNYLYSVAPHDGTVVALVGQDVASQQALHARGVHFDATRFSYIGRVTANVPVHAVWHTAPAQSLEELKEREVITGAAAATGFQHDLPNAENALIGTRWKVVSGYQGRNETALAMQRGEIQAAIAPATLFNNQLKPLLEQHKLKVIVQYADFRHPAFPNVPTITEFAQARETKDVFRLLISAATVGRSYAAPPDVPVETLAILRHAFQAMINDPAFAADAAKRGADILPMQAEQLTAYIGSIVATPAAVIDRTKEVIASK